MLNYYGNERPQGGKIVDGVLFPGTMPFVLLYVLSEGAKYEVLGCFTEKAADDTLKQFEETGEINNPGSAYQPDAPKTIRPYSVVKLEAKASKAWVPEQ
jgi:hypothetical protein